MLNGPKFSQDIFKLQIITFRLDLFEIATSQTSTQYNWYIFLTSNLSKCQEKRRNTIVLWKNKHLFKMNANILLLQS